MIASMNTFSAAEGFGITMLQAQESTLHQEHAVFLDVEVYPLCGFWHSGLWAKPSKVPMYLHKDSAHPEHMGRNVLRGAFLRARRLSSTLEAYMTSSRWLEGAMVESGYTYEEVRSMAKLVRELPLASIKPRKRARFDQDIALHWFWPGGLDLCPDGRLPWCVDALQELSRTPQPVVARLGPSVERLLIRAVPRTKGRFVGFQPRGRPACTICTFVGNTREVRASDGRCWKVRGNFKCDAKDAIYMATCRRWNVFVIGETSCFDTRVRMYTANIHGGRTQGSIQAHFAEHPHTMLVLQVVVLQTLPDSMARSIRGAVRFKLENVWIRRMKPQLNTKKQIHFSFTGWTQAKRPRDPEVG